MDVNGSTPSDPLPDSAEAVAPRIAFANLELRPAECQVLVDNRRISLTVREFEVLHALVERYDRVVKRAQVYERVWGGEMKYRERAVDVFVRKIRTKLAEAAPGWLYIHTHFGIGYRFAPEERLDRSGPAEHSQPSRTEPSVHGLSRPSASSSSRIDEARRRGV